MLTTLALAGWLVSALAMREMTSMDGPGAFCSFLWLWIAMAAGMMLPALVPAASLAMAVGRSGVGFVGAYFTLWAAAGVVAFEAARALTGVSRWLTVGAVAAAAAYQLSPLKDGCLHRCRSPLGSLLRRRAFAAGLEHGLFCLGCCWALMLALIAVGVGSMFWMAAVATAIFLEKATVLGTRASAPVALALIGAAVWIAL